MNTRIFVALSSFAQHGREPLQLLESSGLPFSVNPHGKRLSREELIELAAGSTGVIAGLEVYDRFVLERLPDMRCISRCGVGVDNIDLDVAREKGMAVLNTPEVVIQPVAELTLALIFDLLRKVSEQSVLMHNRSWQRRNGQLLRGKTVGILGLGRIGRKVAELLGKLEAHVCAADIAPDRAWAAAHGVEILPLDHVLRTSDIVSIHLAFIKEQPFQLTREHLAGLKPGALIVNTSRGEFIDEDALYDGLMSGRIGGAALDVFASEPYSGRLTQLPNAILTPHIGSLTDESRVQMEIEAVRHLLDFFAGT